MGEMGVGVCMMCMDVSACVYDVHGCECVMGDGFVCNRGGRDDQ